MNYPELLTLRITVCCWSTCRIYVGYFPRLTICIYFSRLTICIYFQSLFNVTGFIYILLP